MNANPGDVALMNAEDVERSVSTHKVPLSVLMGLIRKEGKETFLIGVQPKSVELGDGLSKIAQTALSNIESVIKAALR